MIQIPIIEESFRNYKENTVIKGSEKRIITALFFKNLGQDPVKINEYILAADEEKSFGDKASLRIINTSFKVVFSNQLPDQSLGVWEQTLLGFKRIN